MNKHMAAKNCQVCLVLKHLGPFFVSGFWFIFCLVCGGRETAVCKFYLTAEGCMLGDECRYKHPRTTGKRLCCGAEGHSLSTCPRPSKSKSGGQPKQLAKGKGRSTPTPTLSQPSSSVHQFHSKPVGEPVRQLIMAWERLLLERLVCVVLD